MMEGENLERLRVTIRGAVQGVGFRPFVYRLATELGLSGWVSNSPQGVAIEVEGAGSALRGFLLRLESEKPPRSFIQSQEHSFLDPIGHFGFTIRESNRSGERSALVLADIATCPDCLHEVFDPRNRRYLYPFTNCTNCGPRFTIIESLPYDRSNTTMRLFEMCEECLEEYEDPHDRRFHAQPNACPRCGPHLELWTGKKAVLARNENALRLAAEVVRRGDVLAVKGLGGFHLMVDARNEAAVRTLRGRKHREEKPLALMYPSLVQIGFDCVVSVMEERLLQSPEAPIVLLRRRKDGGRGGLASSVAPSNPALGVMLPYTPLHHILLKDLGFPVVATSGNLSDEPICIDEHEAADRLVGIADAFLIHHRPIVRHVDDSVVRVMAGREMVVRRARGYAPLPLSIPTAVDTPVLAVGAHLKNAAALSVRENVFVSQHIGDLETAEAADTFRRVTVDLQRLYEVHPGAVVCDMHPEYLSATYAYGLGLPVFRVQHHYAHVASCMAENDLQGRVLGVSWDGTGYGPDGTIWGGEFLLTDNSSFNRVASFRPFRLPGGDKAIREPGRVALGVLFEMFGDELFQKEDLHPFIPFPELHILRRMLERNINCPVTTSAGRLFDAVASLLGLRQHVAFEGQAAMELEFAIGETPCPVHYGFDIIESRQDNGSLLQYRPPMLFDWSQMISGVLADIGQQQPVSAVAAKFHNTLCEVIIEVARRAGERRVVLSGGCFQNKYLTERTIRRLREEGFRPYWHQRVPPNDGGIALGQVYAYARRETSKINPEVEECASTIHEHQHNKEESVG